MKCQKCPTRRIKTDSLVYHNISMIPCIHRTDIYICIIQTFEVIYSGIDEPVDEISLFLATLLTCPSGFPSKKNSAQTLRVYDPVPNSDWPNPEESYTVFAHPVPLSSQGWNSTNIVKISHPCTKRTGANVVLVKLLLLV